MANLSEGNRLGDLLRFEVGEGKYHSRETVTVLGGQNLPLGTVIGKATLGAATTAAAGGGAGGANTGNGTITMDATTPLLAGAQVGRYVAKCTAAASNSGTFRVSDPKGNVLGDVAVGTAFANQIKFTIADGSVDFVVGDGFSITVAAGTGKVRGLNLTGLDGTQHAYGVLLKDVATVGTMKSIAFTSGGTYVVRPGDKVTGATGGATAQVVSVTVSGGTWAGGDAEGTLILDNQVGTFASENLDVGTNANVATVGGDSAAYGPDTEGAAIVRDAVVDGTALVWPSGITAAQKTAALNQLAEKAVVVRSVA